MAKQSGIIKLRGSVDDITFRNTKNGYLMGAKSRLDANAVRTRPSFLLTRQINAEFTRAAKGGSLLRQAFSDQLQKSKDGNIVPRMLKLLMAVIKGDTTSSRGKRTIPLGNLALLQGFNFNDKALFPEVFTAPQSDTVDRVAGTVTVSIPSFIPLNKVKAPASATHYRIVTAAGAIDFDNQVSQVDSLETATLPLDANPTIAINNVLSLSAGTTLPIVVIVGVLFYELVNGEYWEMGNHAYNTMSIVDINP